MREDFGELTETNLKQDLETLSDDIEKLREDVAKLMWKSTVGRAERKIACRPFASVGWAFASGFVAYGLFRIYRSLKKSK